MPLYKSIFTSGEHGAAWGKTPDYPSHVRPKIKELKTLERSAVPMTDW